MRSVSNKRNFYFVLLCLLIFLALMGITYAANCWQYTSQAAGCTSANGCKWKNDSWSTTGWCEDLSCWSLYSQSECANTPITGKNCTWQAGQTNYWCEKLNCWSLSGTSSNACTNNAVGLSCQWSDQCYTQQWTQGVDCWNLANQTACQNATGCAWGQCSEVGCWSYNTNTTCAAAKDPWNKKNCTWQQDAYGSNGYCTSNGCWRYATNQSYCESNPANLNCEWKWNSCQDKDCWSFSYTNQTACTNTLTNGNLSCSWDSTYSNCNKKDCWSYNTESECKAKQECNWKAYTTSGWCNEVNCWTWDSWKGGNESICEANPYSMACTWSVNPGNASNGWCYKNIASTSCANKTTERDCLDTYYCWWQYNNLNNVAAGGLCKEPGTSSWIGTTAGNTTIFNAWNPGCYIFDMNITNCNSTIGCNYTTFDSKCVVISGHANEAGINANGLNCSMINSSSLCNTIPVLSSCCAWQNNTCQANKMTTSCRTEVAQKTEDSCEDAESNARCSQLANDPWYMPCKWNNATTKCEFKAANIFGNQTQSLMMIDNKMNCEAAGGKWLTESYCEGNISIPLGRCEYKFNDEDNCDKACFACENKDSDGNTVNASNAKTACEASKLGFCKFNANANAKNGIGYCEANAQFKNGMAKNCDESCGDCTYKGEKNNNDTTKRPSYHCLISKANSAGGGCKWATDNTTATGGYCLNKGDKTCQDSCDRCDTQTTCQNLGRTAVANKTGSCKWQGDSSTGSCTSNTGEDMEICWDGIDNTNDGLIDCADPACYSDLFCGFVTGSCSSWTSNATCESNDCEWMTDKWGGWCDAKGGQCWKYDSNQSTCTTQSNCKWSNGTGGAWCEQDWTQAETCMGLGKTACNLLTASGCNWTVDTWCAGSGNSTDWCQNYGGWCDYESFKPKNCWLYTAGSTECNSHSGCSWYTDSYSLPHCEVNNSANCWQYNTDNATCAAAGCWWKSDTWGSWCTNPADKCWSSTTQATCQNQLDNTGNNACYWESTSYGGYCQPVCYNSSKGSSSACATASSLCVWKEQNGWCQEQQTCSTKDQANCMGAEGIAAKCRWKTSGWCDPAAGGFSAATSSSSGGMGTAQGGDCYKYDGNQTMCTNKTIINVSCGWIPNPSPICEVNWGTNCWQYTSAATGCNTTNGCAWNINSYSGTGTCMNLMDQCFNSTFQNSNQDLTKRLKCNETSVCQTNSWGGCEPKCMSQTNRSDCIGVSGCRWSTGWCNSAGMSTMFNDMEAGMPSPLGTDPCGEGSITQTSADICGFGMKDMGDSYGFGTGVRDFSSASICNKEQLSSFVMGMSDNYAAGGMMGGPGATTFGTAKTGTGNDTIKYIVYLDTDGSQSGGCALDSNSSAAGYEFRLRYTSIWDVNTSKATETFNAYKCENSQWKATDIKLNAWKKKMCSDFGGPMIAINKADLAKYPALYNSTKDMKVFVAIIGNTGNLSVPTDTAGPGWTTPGSVDFDIADAFSYGADTAKFEDILKNGFVKYEDCFNGFDDDNDGNVDCNDWNCQYSSNCGGIGVNNAANNTDTSAPLVTGVKIETYPDAALIMYDTNKPTNGTLQLYGYGDTTCLNKTDDIYDLGILSANVRDYRLSHSAAIYYTNDTMSNKNVSIHWPLASGSTYNYKLKVCDSSGKCAISKCKNLTTAISTTKCGFCDFVTRIKAPTGWTVSYDIDRDGAYDHVQGQVCGPNAGMKTNYTSGRKINIKLSKDDGTVYFEFLNASLTKTALNDKVRTISATTDLIADANKMGLTADTRDKIINNLNPEGCRIKIPFTGTCDKLYHCDDNGANCTDRTSLAGGAPLDATNCIWNAPYCEFSTYRERLTTTTTDGTTTTTSSGGGGGGGAGTTNKTKTACAEQWECGDWEPCMQEGRQKRACADKNNCGTAINKPNEQQNCAYRAPEEKAEEKGSTVAAITQKGLAMLSNAGKKSLAALKTAGQKTSALLDTISKKIPLLQNLKPVARKGILAGMTIVALFATIITAIYFARRKKSTNKKKK